MSEKPKMQIRRFDVFAEYSRLEALEKGMTEEEAAGYGLWLAKVVASGGGRRGPKAAGGKDSDDRVDESPQEKEPRFRTLGDEEQTDEMFKKEIVQRMGRGFYNKVFSPAITEAYRQNRGYTAIRDMIRRDWKPEN